MLLELKVRNFGIIEDMTWQLCPGLNIITGETGAGKSLIVDAVEFLLSGKADEEVIRHGANETQIEGIFTIPAESSHSPIREFLTQKGIDTEDDMLVINCRLRRSSPAVIRVNGHAVPRTVLQQIGRLLVDIHGQSEHLSLLDIKTHLEFLDLFANNIEARNGFSMKVTALHKLERELKELGKDDADRARREEFLRFQIDEIDRAKLQPGEEEELRQELSVLSSAEKLKELSSEAYNSVNEEINHSSSALDRLNEAVLVMKKLVELDPSQADKLKFLDEAACSLTETMRDIRSYSENVNYDPARIEEIETRLGLINDLKKKYGPGVTGILDYRVKAERELNEVCNYAEKCKELEDNIIRLQQELGRDAGALSAARAKTAGRLVTAVKNELADLNMSQVKFEVDITLVPDAGGIPFPDGKLYTFNAEGADNVVFMVSTNPGEPAKPLAKIASTGELSRFTLALKSALSEGDNIPVVIFDEIDIGIGGRSGEIIGRKLYGLSRSRQVICITHLPQIAVFADAHFGIRKVTADNRTTSILEVFDGDARVKELAAMLAGADYGATALKNARELIQKAEGWKRGQRKGR